MMAVGDGSEYSIKKKKERKKKSTRLTNKYEV